jgi:hypothetical protein
VDPNQRDVGNQPTTNTGSLGAGAEATEAMHGAQGGDVDDQERTTAEGAHTGRDGALPGSEPLSRSREHTPSYGGLGGAPRTSSDTREPADPHGTSQQPAGAPTPVGDEHDAIRQAGGRTSDHEGGSADAIRGDAGEQPINPT